MINFVKRKEHINIVIVSQYTGYTGWCKKWHSFDLVAIFVVVDLQTIFNTQCAGTCMNDLCIKFYMPSWNC